MCRGGRSTLVPVFETLLNEGVLLASQLPKEAPRLGGSCQLIQRLQERQRCRTHGLVSIRYHLQTQHYAIRGISSDSRSSHPTKVIFQASLAQERLNMHGNNSSGIAIPPVQLLERAFPGCAQRLRGPLLPGPRTELLCSQHVCGCFWRWCPEPGTQGPLGQGAPSEQCGAALCAELEYGPARQCQHWTRIETMQDVRAMQRLCKEVSRQFACSNWFIFKDHLTALCPDFSTTHGRKHAASAAVSCLSWSSSCSKNALQSSRTFRRQVVLARGSHSLITHHLRGIAHWRQQHPVQASAPASAALVHCYLMRMLRQTTVPQ